jgi:hypothetical protein
MLELLERQKRLTANQWKIISAAILGDMRRTSTTFGPFGRAGHDLRAFWSCWRTGSRQFVEQRFGFFEIGRAKSLR